jgi:hypothetical protein
MNCFTFFKIAFSLLIYPSSEIIIHLSVHSIILGIDGETFVFSDYLLLISTILFYFYKIFLADFFPHSKNSQFYQLFNCIVAALEFISFVIFT